MPIGRSKSESDQSNTREIFEVFRKINSFGSFAILVRVPEHAGVLTNEAADSLAREAATLSRTVLEVRPLYANESRFELSKHC